MGDETASGVPVAVPDVAAELFRGESEMAARMRAYRWQRSALGPPEAWPQSLRTAIGICLGSRFPILIWWGRELRMLYNDGYRPMLGETKHPGALGRPGIEVWPEIWDIIGPMLDGVVERGEATWSDDQLLPLHRSGYVEECYFTFSYSPIVDDSGGVGGVFTAVTETTERVLAERRLEALHDLGALSGLAATEDEACALANGALAGRPDTRCTAVFRLDGGEPVAAASTFAHLEEEPATAAAVRSVVASGEAVEVAPVAPELVAGVDLPEGERPQAVYVLPLGGSTGEVVGALVAALNPRRALDDAYRSYLGLVAEQVGRLMAGALQEERRRAEEYAQLDRAKTMFFGNVSHELRTPLTLILGPLEEALARTRSESGGSDELLETARRNVLRLLRLVNTLLDFSRLESSRPNLRFRPTDVTRLTEQIASAFAPAIENSRLRFVVRCQPLPELPYVDAEAWERIVSNLLSNAFKYTLRGEIRLTLEANGGVQLRVADTGSGISDEHLPRLFERFYRGVNPEARTHEGTGIGLALTNELVKLHGGALSVESAVGRGSTFIVSLPFGSAHLPPEQLDDRAGHEELTLTPDAVDEIGSWHGRRAAKEPAPHAHVRERVLVADDNSDMREYLARLLEPRWAVETCVNGAEALKAIRADPPALVLTDVMMPELDGFELLQALRADQRTAAIPVIAVSARAGEERAVEGLEAGADDYLVKPFSARELIARVAINLELARLRVELGALNALDEMRSRVLSTVSHELRTPVSAIHAASLTLEREGLDASTESELRSVIKGEAARLAQLTEDVLSAAHLTSGVITVSLETVDVRALVSGAVAVARTAKPEEIELGAVLPDGPVPVQADPDRLRQVLANLLDNAVKYSPGGGAVTVSVEPSPDGATIAVADEGIGIPPSARERVFDRFVRLDPELRAGVGGIGLGLYICRELIESMGGRIWVEGREGRGSRFVVALRAPRR